MLEKSDWNYMKEQHNANFHTQFELLYTLRVERRVEEYWNGLHHFLFLTFHFYYIPKCTLVLPLKLRLSSWDYQLEGQKRVPQLIYVKVRIILLLFVLEWFRCCNEPIRVDRLSFSMFAIRSPLLNPQQNTAFFPSFFSTELLFASIKYCKMNFDYH